MVGNFANKRIAWEYYAFSLSIISVSFNDVLDAQQGDLSIFRFFSVDKQLLENT